MSDLQDLIHRNAQLAFEQGVKTERERIIKLLKPLAEHDNQMCYFEGEQECWPNDCLAPLYQDAIDLIKGEQK